RGGARSLRVSDPRLANDFAQAAHYVQRLTSVLLRVVFVVPGLIGRSERPIELPAGTSNGAGELSRPSLPDPVGLDPRSFGAGDDTAALMDLEIDGPRTSMQGQPGCSQRRPRGRLPCKQKGP